MEMEKNKKNRYGFDFTPMGLDIKTFREAQKITREKLAETLDITPRHLQAIELEGKHPSLGLLAYIATIFDMPIDPYILSDGELRETQTANYFSNLYPIDCAVPSVDA